MRPFYTFQSMNANIPFLHAFPGTKFTINPALLQASEERDLISV